MKRVLLLAVCVLLLASCKKTEFAPEGPTDVRIRNLSDQVFTNVIISTSEYEEDVATIASIPKGGTSEYQRFKKAYPKCKITATINVDGSSLVFSTGDVSYTFMQYLSTQRVTFEVFIPEMSARKLEISKLIPDEELVLE